MTEPSIFHYILYKIINKYTFLILPVQTSKNLFDYVQIGIMGNMIIKLTLKVSAEQDLEIIVLSMLFIKISIYFLILLVKFCHLASTIWYFILSIEYRKILSYFFSVES